jgi:hypothetical protein
MYYLGIQSQWHLIQRSIRSQSYAVTFLKVESVHINSTSKDKSMSQIILFSNFVDMLFVSHKLHQLICSEKIMASYCQV